MAQDDHSNGEADLTTGPTSSSTKVVDAASSGLWDELAHRPDASVFVSPPWLATLATTYSVEPQGVVVVDRDGPRSGLAYVVMDDAVGRRRLSLPFSDYADPVLGLACDRRTLLESFADCDQTTTRTRVLHTDRAAYAQLFQATGEAAWHSVSLDRPGGPDAMWQSLSGSARRNIRKARSAGVTVEISNTVEATHRFFEMHLETRKHKYRLLPQPRHFFTEMRQHFLSSDGFWIATASHNGAPIAAILLLEWNDVAYYKFNASFRASLAVRPNDLLMWEAIVFSQSRDRRRLDLGVSDLDQPGLIRYKNKFATEEASVATFSRGLPPTEEVIDLRERLSAVTHALTDESVPDPDTAFAGAAFYRFFS